MPDQPSSGGLVGTPSRETLLFFVITYAVTWTCFITAGLVSDAAPWLRLTLLLAGSFVPSSVALILAGVLEGRAGVRALRRRLLIWRVKLRWYVFAVGYLAVIKLLAAVLQRVATGEWPAFGQDAWYAIAAAILIVWIFGGPLGEELGWRGFALPRLNESFGPAVASVVLGLVWACWHLPLFFMSGLGSYGDQHGQSFPVYLLQVTALSVAIAWLFHNTGGSLLLAILMHSAINQTKDIVTTRVPGATNSLALSTSLTAWLTVLLLWICAGYFLFRMHTARMQPA